jgi:hypothetical protein
MMNERTLALYRFDCQLCDYACSNLACQGGGDRYRSQMSNLLDNSIAEHVFGPSALNQPLKSPRLPLSTLLDLIWAGEALSDRFRLVWQPYPELHRRRLKCVPEIRQGVTIRDAEVWASRSDEFAALLEQPDVPLHVGLGIVTEWIELARDYLAALGHAQWHPEPRGLAAPKGPDVDPAPARHAAAVAEEAVLAKPAALLQVGEECSVDFAAKVLGVDRKTVLKYIAEGVLEWRNAAAPSSTRKRYRVRMASVLRLCSAYRTTTEAESTARHRARRRRKLPETGTRHIKVNRG